MTRIFFIVTFFFLLFGCDQNTQNKEGYSPGCYDQLILNVALSYPDYKCYKCTSDESYKHTKELILHKSKEVTDESLGLYMALHKWTYDGGQSCPKTIVYVSDMAGFEYAFPFYDECNYARVNPDSLRTVKSQLELQKRLTFQNHLNFVRYGLKLNTSENKEKLNSVITLVADTLLGMREFTINDTTELIELSKNERYKRISKSCAQNFEENISEIIELIKKEDVRIFSTSEGFGGFWKFEVTSNQGGDHYINATLENNECYFAVYF